MARRECADILRFFLSHNVLLDSTELSDTRVLQQLIEKVLDMIDPVQVREHERLAVAAHCC